MISKKVNKKLNKKNTDMHRANVISLLFLGILLVVFYTRATYFGNQDKVEKRHSNEKLQKKIAEALKHKQKEQSVDYDEPDYTSDTVLMRPLVDVNYNPKYDAKGSREEFYKARSKELAMKLVKEVLKSQLKDLTREILLLYAKQQKKIEQERALKMYIRKIIFDGEKYEKTEVFIKSGTQTHSNWFQKFVGKEVFSKMSSLSKKLQKSDRLKRIFQGKYNKTNLK